MLDKLREHTFLTSVLLTIVIPTIIAYAVFGGLAATLTGLVIIGGWLLFIAPAGFSH
jgi:hypothetical protein